MTGQWSPRYADGLTPRPAPVEVEHDDTTPTTEPAPLVSAITAKAS